MQKNKKNSRNLKIVYEDDFMFVVNKPPRIPTVPGNNIQLNQSILGMAEKQFAEKGIKPYVLHRLDSQTSGALMFGKYEKDRPELAKIFTDKNTSKKYATLVQGVPNGSCISIPLHARASQELVPAETNYKIIKVFRGKSCPLCALVEATIHTGRKHQIRQHFAKVGHFVILDSKYGDPHFNRKFRIHFRLGRQFLHAAEVNFFHPILKKQVQILAPLPMDLQNVIKKLQFGQ